MKQHLNTLKNNVLSIFKNHNERNETMNTSEFLSYKEFQSLSVKEQLEYKMQLADKYKSTSERYRTVNTNDITSTIESVLEQEGMEYTKKFSFLKSRGCSTKHCIEFRLTNMEFDISHGDKGIPRIVLFNSFNGESAFTLFIGVFRFVCSNGLTIGDEYFKTRMIHVQGETIETKLKTLEQNVRTALMFIKTELQPILKSLAETPVSASTELKVLEGLKEAKGVKLSDKAVSSIRNQLESANRRELDSNRTLWSLYNIVNEVLANRSRSEYRNELKNTSLMAEVIKLAV